MISRIFISEPTIFERLKEPLTESAEEPLSIDITEPETAVPTKESVNVTDAAGAAVPDPRQEETETVHAGNKNAKTDNAAIRAA